VRTPNAVAVALAVATLLALVLVLVGFPLSGLLLAAVTAVVVGVLRPATPPRPRRALLGVGLVAGLLALVVAVADVVVRGHRSTLSTGLVGLAAVLAVVLVALAALPPSAAPGPTVLRRTAATLAVVGFICAIVVVLTVPFLPGLRSVGYDSVDPGTDLVLSRPPGTEDGDVLVAQIHYRGPGALRAPQGWTRIAATPVTPDGAETAELWTHVADSEEPATYAFSTDLPGGKIGGITAWSNVATVVVRAEEKGQGGSMAVPALTVETSTAPLLYYATTAGVTRMDPPTGLAEQFQTSSDGVFKASMALEVRGPTGAEDVDPVSLAATPAGGWVVQVVELDPT